MIVIIIIIIIIMMMMMLIAPAGFWPRGQNPRRHPRTPRVYTYKEFQKCKDESK